jgi:homoserine O-acetyltransferase
MRYTIVACQHRLIKALGVERLRLVIGYSMGALQVFEWGCQHAEMVDAILPICGAARVSPHNYLFLDGVKAALLADQSFAEGDYTAPPINGLRAFGRVYTGWVFSQTFFRNEVHKDMGMPSIEDVVGFMQAYFMRRDANDLLGMIWTWQHADISANDRFRGDFKAALASISARAIVMPGNTDLYFTVADSAIEVNTMPNAELRPIDSILGHVAGSGLDPVGKRAIDQAVLELLAIDGESARA